MVDRCPTSSRPVDELQRRGVGFRSLQESIDTTTPAGKLIFHIFGALAEFERDLIHERTAAVLAAARARGRLGGRPSCMTPQKLAVARQMYDSGEHTVEAIAATIGVSRARALNASTRHCNGLVIEARSCDGEGAGGVFG